MSPPSKDNLSKEDLFLLLESYKNSVEMNTLISQQLTTIQDLVSQCKDEQSGLESNVIKHLDDISELCNKVRDKIEAHDKESLKGFSKLANRVNILYVATGSLVISLIVLIIQIVEKFDLLKHIATHLGV
jgi:CHASE3 domain sensor protein